MAERAGKISVRTGRLKGFNCCIQIYNGRVDHTKPLSLPLEVLREKT